MPYKSEKIKLKGLQDRRKRLTDEQRKEIEELYGTGMFSLNDLAKKFNVSKKSILLIVNKDSAEKAKQYRKAHWQAEIPVRTSVRGRAFQDSGHR